jgi:DNA-binding NtrC family response regulator
MHQSVALSGSQARIMVLDGDAASSREAVGALRAMLPDAATEATRSGRAAVEMLRRSSCDLLLVDVASTLDLSANPEEAVGRLARCATGALIVALSDGGSVSAAMAAMRSGAHEFIARPMDRADFLNRIAALARRHGRSTLLPRGSDWLGEGAANTATRPVRGAAVEPLVLPMWRQEQRIIEAAIRHFSGNITMAAAALELSPSTIYRKRQAWIEMECRKGAA